VRCPACGASNTERASWCTQCFRDLREPATPGPERGPASADAAAGGQGAGTRGSGARDVRSIDGEVEWRCVRCEGWNPLEAGRCTACEAPRHGFGEVAAPPTIDAADRPRLVAATAVLPGLGHLLARRTGSGLARALLGVGWLVGGLAVLRGEGAGALPAAPLLLGAAVIWAGSLHDVLALGAGGRELLTPRTLLWATGGVLLALLVTLAVSANAAGG
jgi:hypothetical protein